MTLKELSALYYVKREMESRQRSMCDLIQKITAAEEELSAMREDAGQIGSPAMSDMPKSSSVSSAVERDAMALVAKEEQIRKLCAMRQALLEKFGNAQIREAVETARLTERIAQIDEAYIRLIFTLRFIECLSWEEVAFNVSPASTVESVKKACYRYIREHEKEDTKDV